VLGGNWFQQRAPAAAAAENSVRRIQRLMADHSRVFLPCLMGKPDIPEMGSAAAGAAVDALFRCTATVILGRRRARLRMA